MLVLAGVAGCGASPPPRESAAAAPALAPRLAAYARLVHDRFDAERALETAAYADRYFRVRGNEGYVRTLERVREALLAAGFPHEAVRTLALGPVRPTWTPRSARLELAGEAVIAFEDESERDRACLLVGSAAVAEREIEIVRAEDVRRGESARGRAVLIEGDPAEAFDAMVRRAGAIAILVRDPARSHRTSEHPDAARFGYLPSHVGTAFGFSLSSRAWERLRAATQTGPARARVRIDVTTGRSAAGVIEARIDGSDRGAGAIVFVAHADEPGANDNASGVAALAELASVLRRAIDEGAVAHPRRSLVFLWGQELEVSRAWLDDPPLPVGAGLVMDMVGQDPDVVGAPFLIERMPDPGAIWLRAPDAHTEWGATEIAAGDLRGHFLNDLAAAAATAVETFDGPWSWRSHPYEGGSDHALFLAHRLPALLAWHFPDSAYHTTLDRMDRVSGAEMRRVAAVLGAVALAMAGGDRADAIEMVQLVLGAARARLASLEAASAVLVREGRSSSITEAQVRRAWIDWYDEALASIATWSERDRTIHDLVREARRTLRATARQ